MKKTYIQQLGADFQYERKNQNKSVKEVAEKIGVGVQAIHRFENGDVSLSHKKVIKYAEVLDVRIKAKIKPNKKKQHG